MRQLDFAVENGFNVLMEGLHGCGKTGRTISTWRKYGYTDDINGDKIFSYFNTPTVDVYEDIKGIPYNNNGKLAYIRPDHRAWEKVEWIMFDEPNRAHQKVINTLYELLQFKSINGVRIPNLKGVWSAMNPHGDEYTVESVDQSFIDRFQIYLWIPCELDKDFFIGKGLTERKFHQVVEWWKSIPDNVRQKHASPRRVEYAIDVFKQQGEVEWVLKPETNPSVLAKILSTTATTVIKTAADPEKAKAILDNISFYLGSMDHKELAKALKEIPREVWVSQFPYTPATKYADRKKISDFLTSVHSIGILGYDIIADIADYCALCPNVLVQIRHLNLTNKSKLRAIEHLRNNFPQILARL